MSRSSTITFSAAGRIVWVYQTRGCGTVTPEEFREMLQRLEQRLGRPVSEHDIPWDYMIIDEYALEVSTDAEDDRYSSDLADAARWGYCHSCGVRGGNAVRDSDDGLRFECQRCGEVFADPWDDQLLYR